MNEHLVALIELEQGRQRDLHGDRDHADLVWFGILSEEVGEVSKSIIDRLFLLIRESPPVANPTLVDVKELIEVMAVCTSWMEAISHRNHLLPPSQIAGAPPATIPEERVDKLSDVLFPFKVHRKEQPNTSQIDFGDLQPVDDPKCPGCGGPMPTKRIEGMCVECQFATPTTREIEQSVAKLHDCVRCGIAVQEPGGKCYRCSENQNGS